LALLLLSVAAIVTGFAPADEAAANAAPVVSVIDPPESGFLAKRLNYEGIPIKAPANVVDEALFAELTMWYFGTHGDLQMKGPKPALGRQGLKDYDPEAFTLLDDFYSGRMEPPSAKPVQPR
jgi:hypothetical protein